MLELHPQSSLSNTYQHIINCVCFPWPPSDLDDTGDLEEMLESLMAELNIYLAQDLRKMEGRDPLGARE